MKTAVAYIRVSTDSQDEYSPDAQKRLIKEYAKQNDIILTEVFQDIGISGTKASKRPQFQNMIAQTKQKDCSFDTILVWKFSRFARNQEESIVYKSMLKKNGIDVISVSEPMPNDIYGGLIERIIEWMDEYYSIRLSEEVKRGMSQKAMQGKWQGKAPYGYIVENEKLVVDESKRDIVKYIFNEFAYGTDSILSLSRKLNAMNIELDRKIETRTLKYMVRNIAYVGYVRWNPDNDIDYGGDTSNYKNTIIVENAHEPIIEKEVFDLCQKKLQKNQLSKYSKPIDCRKHWLSGMLRCGNCGGSLALTNHGRDFQCDNYKRGKCSLSCGISIRKIEKYTLEKVQELTTDKNFEFEIIKDNSDSSIDIIEQTQKSIKQLDNKEKRIKDAYINGIDTLEEYKENKAKLQKEKDELENVLKTLKSKDNKTDEKDKMCKNIQHTFDVISNEESSLAEKSDAIRGICSKIIIDKKNKNIDFILYLKG